MFPVTQRFLANLGLVRWIPRVEWQTGHGAPWQPLDYLDGSVSAKSTSQVRWEGALRLSGAVTGRAGIHPYGCRLRMFTGMWFGPNDVEWVPLGRYRIEDVTTEGRNQIDFTAKIASLETQVQDARFHKPRVIDAGSSKFTVEKLIREALPEASVSWQVPDTTLPQFTEERDRWGVLDGRSGDPSIARSLSARLFCDARGEFMMRAVPSLDDDPVWSLDYDDGGVLVAPQESLSREGVYNQIVVTGGSDTGDIPIGPAIASDEDPVSPTSAKGPFGQVPLFYNSKLITTYAQAQATALAMLAPRLGLKQTVTVDAMSNPALEPDDVISIRMPNGSVQNHVLDEITYSPTGGLMRVNTRATTSRQAGVVIYDPAENPTEGQIDA